MKKLTKYILTAVVLIALLAFVIIKLKSNQKSVEERVYYKDTTTSVSVQAIVVKDTAFGNSEEFLGSFAPYREVSIGSIVSGRVTRVGVQEGSRVGAGSLIAQLDATVLQAQLRSAQANYQNAQATLSGAAQANLANAEMTVKRYVQAENGVTQLQLDNARTQVQVFKSQIDNARAQILMSKATVDQLQKQINDYTIKAPFSGIVTNRSFDLGAVVSPGQQLGTITDIENLKLEVSVPEMSINEFKLGQALIIKADAYAGGNLSGKVDLISSKGDANHNYIVKILVPNPGGLLKAGMYGTVVMSNIVSHSAISVPRSALVGSNVSPQIYVLENGVARLHDITIGNSNEYNIQVTSGIKSGDTVVTGGIVNLINGSKVHVTNL